MGEYGIVMTTFENKEQAIPVIDKVLQRQLAACVQTTNIESHYTWKNEVCHSDEVLVLFKTRQDLYEELKSQIEELHPYETAEILYIDIDKGAQDYLNWIDLVTKKRGER